MKLRIAYLSSSLLLTLAAFAQSSHTATKADFDKWMKQLSNWGRWGKDDQRGTVNLITPAKVKHAASLAKLGITVSLEHPIMTESAEDNANPLTHTMTATGENPVAGAYAMDSYAIAFHGYGHTHMDALGHAFQNGQMYNGYPQSSVTKDGAMKNDILAYQNGIVTRGILVDIPRLKGIPYLEPGAAVYVEDIEAWEKKAGVKIGSGDAVLVRTGRWARRAARGPWNAGEILAGLHVSVVPWLKQRDVAILAGDGASDVMPSQVEGVSQPVHFLMLVAVGSPLFDNCDLEQLAEIANRLGRWEFMFTAAPLAVPRGTGSPLNPIAVF
ncbi:MAG: Cyclase [Bryobacterales bacterium]|nr:Cyclase [Bryobacterales bacterium]